jgi:hypothetical protein
LRTCRDLALNLRPVFAEILNGVPCHHFATKFSLLPATCTQAMLHFVRRYNNDGLLICLAGIFGHVSFKPGIPNRNREFFRRTNANEHPLPRLAISVVFEPTGPAAVLAGIYWLLAQ